MANKNLFIYVRQRGAKQAEAGMRNLGASIAGTIGQYFALGVAVTKVTQFLKDSVKAYARQELAEKKLATAIGHTSKFLLNRAAALQQVTVYGDEQIIEAQALIGSFIKEESAIDAATKATLDLAAAKGMDLKAAADLISKTLGSSTNALSRYGIQVEGAVGSTKRLQSLTESIAKVFGGQAQKQAETLSGKIQQLSNSYGDLQETVGKFLVETGDLPKFLNDIKKFTEELNKEIKGSSYIDLLGKLAEKTTLLGYVIKQLKSEDIKIEGMELIPAHTNAINNNKNAISELEKAYQEFATKQREKIEQQKQETAFLKRFNAELIRQQGLLRDVGRIEAKPIIDFGQFETASRFVDGFFQDYERIKVEPIELIDVTKLKAAQGLAVSIADSIELKYQNIASMVQNLMGSAFTAAFTEGESVAEAFFNSLKRMILNLATQTLAFSVLNAILPGFGSMVGGIGGFLGFRASGGPIQRDKPYIVGEDGPELIIPKSSGTVISNQQIMRMSQQDQPKQVNQNINITFAGAVTDKQYVDSYIIPRIKKAVRLGKV